MKKILSLALSVVLLLSVVACSSDEVKETTKKDTPQEITHGSIQGKVYKSKFTGITFTAPNGWTYLSDKEIASLYNTSTDAVDLEKFAESMKKIKNYTEMMATTDSGNNISIAYDNLALNGNSGISDKAYLDLALQQMQDAMSSMTVKLVETKSVSLSGHTYLRAQLETVAYGVTMQQYLYLRSINGYMVCISITLIDGFTISEMEALFS